MDRLRYLSRREATRLILSALQRVETKLSATSDYMTTALTALDDQLTQLQGRLTADAQALQDAIASANLAAGDTTALQAAADRVKATADLVGGLAQPSAVADEGQPDVEVTPIPEAETPATPAEPPAPFTPTGDEVTDPGTIDPSQATPGDPTGGQ